MTKLYYFRFISMALLASIFSVTSFQSAGGTFLEANGSTGASSELCGENTIEFRNDVADGTYFDAQRIQTTILPQDYYRTIDGDNWFGESPTPLVGSTLAPTYTVGWSIEVHYSDAAIDQYGEWKYSNKTGNRYAVLRGKHFPPGRVLPTPTQHREQKNTHLSILHSDRRTDWDALDAKIDAILNDPNSVVGYSAITRAAAARDVIGKLSKWIKNYRLLALVNGGSNYEGAIHPTDFVGNAPSYCQGASNTITTMAAHLGIPARTGVTRDHAWAEVYFDGKWHFVENQPETFLDTMSPPIDVYGYTDSDGIWRRGYMPKTQSDRDLALNRNAVFDGGLQDLIASPQSFNLVEGQNRYSWFFNWSNPFMYDEYGQTHGNWDLAIKPEIYSDAAYKYYTCNYTSLQNSGYCSYSGRIQAFAENMSSVAELAALYPSRISDLPYVCAKDEGADTNVVYLTRIRSGDPNIEKSDSVRIKGLGGARKQFYLSDMTGIESVYAVLYLGQDNKTSYTIPANGGNWYYNINGRRVNLSSVNGMQVSNGDYGLESNYLGTGQRVLRYKINLSDLVAQDSCQSGGSTAPDAGSGTDPVGNGQYCRVHSSSVDGLGTSGSSLFIDHDGGRLSTSIACPGYDCSFDRVQFAVYDGAGNYQFWTNSGSINEVLAAGRYELQPRGWYYPITFTTTIEAPTASGFYDCPSSQNSANPTGETCRSVNRNIDGMGQAGDSVSIHHKGGLLRTQINCTGFVCDGDRIQLGVYDQAGDYQFWANSGSIDRQLSAGNYEIVPRGWYEPVEFELAIASPTNTVITSCN